MSAVLVNPLVTVQVPAKRPLSKRQAECKLKLAALIASKGYSPTYQEICKAFKIRSLAAAFRMIRQLETKGHLRRDRARGRRAVLEMVP